MLIVAHDSSQVFNAHFAVQRVVLVHGLGVQLGLGRRDWGLLFVQVDFKHFSEKNPVFILDLRHALYSTYED